MMPRIARLKKKLNTKTFYKLLNPARELQNAIPSLEPGGNRPLQMTFDDQLSVLVYFHLEEHTSGRHLLQALEEDDFAHQVVAPADGIKKSSFFEAINSRGLEQMSALFNALSAKAANVLPREYSKLGDLVAIDGSLIDAVLSMHWADYRDGAKKAKTHIGFNINQGIPTKLFLTEGKADERPFVSQILVKGQTGIVDRYYQCHKNFDLWQREKKHFICRLRANTKKTEIHPTRVVPGGIVFYDAVVLLGTKNVNQTEDAVRVVGYKVDGNEY